MSNEWTIKKWVNVNIKVGFNCSLCKTEIIIVRFIKCINLLKNTSNICQVPATSLVFNQW